MNVGTYLLRQLERAGVKHVFGIPGDYILDFYTQLIASPLEHVGTSTELGAGFAADAYARVNGVGALCVTYCVGGFNALNAVAGAYAEKSPLIVVCGAPGLEERQRSPLLHHQVRDHMTQLQIFEKVTAAAIALEDPATAPREIDDIIALCLRRKRPVYIELPRGMAAAPCALPKKRVTKGPTSSPDVLQEALDEACTLLRKARRPVLLGGVEIHRFGLQKPFLKLVEHSGYPVAATILGKSIVREDHPQYLGIYEGAMGRDAVRKRVEQSDCLVILGAFMTDINLGINTAKLDVSRTINVNSERLSIKHHHYEQVLLVDFIAELTKALPATRRKVSRGASTKTGSFRARHKPLTVRRLFSYVDTQLTRQHMVICDIGDSLFGATDLTIRAQTEFLSPAYYTSMGFAVPAALGAQLAAPRRRPLVFVGDGAFQMTGQELSSIVRQGLNPIVVVLNNKGYTTERFIIEGPFNDIHNWAYHQMPTLLDAGWGCEVRTEQEFVDAFGHAQQYKGAFSLINVHLDPLDHSESLERLGRSLATRK